MDCLLLRPHDWLPVYTTLDASKKLARTLILDVLLTTPPWPRAAPRYI